MKKLFVFLMVMLIMLLPMTAMAFGEEIGEDLAGLITPETGIWWSLLIVAGVIVADTAFGVIVGLKTKTFDLSILPKFLMTGVVPYLGGLLILAILAHFIGPAFAGMFFTAAVFVVGKYFKDLTGKIKALFATGV